MDSKLKSKTKIMAQPKNIFKYENRHTGQISYFGKQGNDYFKLNAKFKNFKLVGMVSEAEKLEEEEAALNAANSQKTEQEEIEIDESKSKSKAKTKELTADEISKSTKGKKVKVDKDPDDLDEVDPTRNLQ